MLILCFRLHFHSFLAARFYALIRLFWVENLFRRKTSPEKTATIRISSSSLKKAFPAIEKSPSTSAIPPNAARGIKARAIITPAVRTDLLVIRIKPPEMAADNDTRSEVVVMVVQ